MSTLDERLMATASRRALEMHATEWHKSGMEEPVLRAAVFKHAELHGIDALAANEIANAVAKIKRDENPASWPAPWDWEAVASRSVAPPQFAIPSLAALRIRVASRGSWGRRQVGDGGACRGLPRSRTALRRASHIAAAPRDVSGV